MESSRSRSNSEDQRYLQVVLVHEALHYATGTAKRLRSKIASARVTGSQVLTMGVVLACAFWVSSCAVGREHTSDAKLTDNFFRHENEFNCKRPVKTVFKG
jgi:hypothetical protein